jgi:hypothetical protein
MAWFRATTLCRYMLATRRSAHAFGAKSAAHFSRRMVNGYTLVACMPVHRLLIPNVTETRND